MKEHLRRHLEHAEALGVAHPHIIHRGEKFPRLVGHVDGQPIKFVVACTNQHGHQLRNSLTRLRHRIMNINGEKEIGNARR